MVNRLPGLARGPIDHQASSVINVIANGTIDMGSAVALDQTPLATNNEILPRVEQITTQGSGLAYGVAVGGDADGIYGDGTLASDDTTKATTGAGQGVVVVTRGRCLARVVGSNSGGNQVVAVGDPLTLDDLTGGGVLQVAIAGDIVIARALVTVASAALDMIPVEVNKEGIF